jgi:hypothetical protein
MAKKLYEFDLKYEVMFYLNNLLYRIFYFEKRTKALLADFAFYKYCFYKGIPLELCLFKTTFKAF